MNENECEMVPAMADCSDECTFTAEEREFECSDKYEKYRTWQDKFKAAKADITSVSAIYEAHIQKKSKELCFLQSGLNQLQKRYDELNIHWNLCHAREERLWKLLEAKG